MPGGSGVPAGKLRTSSNTYANGHTYSDAYSHSNADPNARFVAKRLGVQFKQ